MSLKKVTVPSKAPLSVLASVEGGLEPELQRLQGLAKAIGKAQWVLVDEGEGLATQLAQHPALKALKAEALACAPGTGDWGRYAAAAARAQGRYCLLLPRTATAAPELFKAMQAACVGGAQLVFSRRPAGPGWAYAAEDWLWRLPGLDLGSPVLVARERWAVLAQALKPGAFLGLRLARLALQSGIPVCLCLAAELAPAKHGFSILGESVGAGRFFMAGAQIAAGALLFLASLFMVMPMSHFFGLSLMGVGFFAVCTVVGEE